MDWEASQATETANCDLSLGVIYLYFTRLELCLFVLKDKFVFNYP